MRNAADHLHAQRYDRAVQTLPGKDVTWTTFLQRATSCRGHSCSELPGKDVTWTAFLQPAASCREHSCSELPGKDVTWTTFLQRAANCVAIKAR
eukprot:943070-Pelagomonas_calceolata.AAC.7